MKKLTALLLAILMIGGLLPTVFAADIVTDPVYMFTSDVFGVTSGSFNSALATNPNRTISTGYYVYAHQLNLDGQSFNMQHAWPWNDDEAEFGNSALILKAKVDKAGTYDAAIEYARYTYSGKMGVYFVPASWLEANYTVKSITDIRPIITNENAVCFVKDLDTHASAGSDTVYNASDILLSENDYYIFITVDKSDYATNDFTGGDKSLGRYYSCIKSISLTSKAFATATLSDSNLKPGETATIAVAAEDKSGSALELSDITYKSSNTDVATVSANGVVTAVGKGDAIITATGNTGEMSLSATTSVHVSFDYIYAFMMEAVPNATAAVPISKITKFNTLNPEVSTGDYYYVTNKNFSTFSLYSGGTQCYSLKQHVGDSYIILKGKVDEPGVYDTNITFSKAAYGGRLNVYVVPAKYAESKWTMTSNALNIGEIIADGGVTKALSVDCHQNSTDVSPINGATLNLTEKEFYFIMTTEMGAADTSDGRYYGLQKAITFDCKGTLSAELAKNIKKPGESAKLSVSAKDSSGKVATPENVTYKSSDSNVATVASDGTVTIKGEGIAKITTTATVGGVEISADTYVDGSIVWNPKFAFGHKYVKYATAEIKNGLGIHQVTELDDTLSTGKWTYVNVRKHYAIALYESELQFSVVQSDFGKNAAVVDLEVDRAGTYIPSMTYGKRNYMGKVNAYILPKSYVDSKGWKMTSDALPIETIEAESEAYRFASANGYSATTTTGVATGAPLNLDDHSYLMIVLHNNDENIINDASKRLWGAIMDVTLTRTGSVKLLADKATLSKGDTTTLIAKTKDNRDNAVEAEVTLTSLNTAVATVSGNTVTAVAPGVAEIKATATIDGVEVSDTVEITVGEETVAKSVSIATSIDGAKASVASYTRGAKVTVTAPEITGKTFRHWVRGTADNGEWVSADAEYSFTATTHTYLTAIYTNEATGKLVEFFNGNGEYLSEAVADANDKVALPANPSITGYVFDKWLLDKNTEFTAETILTADVTRVVAEYKDADKTYTVNGESYKYGDEATFTSDSDVVWKRNDKAVAYGKSYTYYVWDDATIEGTSGNAEPMVVLDADVKDGNAYMIEYDACGKNIVEVGIIFGNGNHTVDSCDSKATSQRKLNHGQFTAKPGKSGNTVARGYLVYEENGAYKVVYSK